MASSASAALLLQQSLAARQNCNKLFGRVLATARVGSARSVSALAGATSSYSRRLLLPAAAAAGARLSPTAASTTPTTALRWFASYPPHEVVGLPSLSPTMDSGSIAAWNVQSGDTFQPGDVFCSIETDKAVVDFEAQDEGVVAQLLVPAGAGDVPVGAPILITVQDPEHVAAFRDYKVDSAAAASTTAAPPATPAAASTPPVSTKPLAAVPAATPTTTTGDKVIFASPLARMLAQELGYDIAAIPGTGPKGRVLAADVKEFQPAAAAAAATAALATREGATTTAPFTATTTTMPSSWVPPPIPGLGSYKDYPLTAQAQQVAAQLVQSKRNVPHYYLTVDVVVDQLLQLRESLNAGTATAKTSDTTTPPPIGVYEFLIKAAAASMQTVPAVNASWMESVVRVYDQVDVNVVTGAGDTLQQPVLRNVAAKGLRAIGQELQAAVVRNDEKDAAASSTTPPVETGLGTFTVINLGMYGIRSCAPIIREPQACALSIGALENRIVPATNNSTSDSDSIYQQSVVFTATLSCDHRVVDGAVGAQWLAAFKAHVENPTTLLL